MKLLIRPAPEVAIKSKPVRQQQMRQLRQNIRKLLARLDQEIRLLAGAAGQGRTAVGRRQAIERRGAEHHVFHIAVFFV